MTEKQTAQRWLKRRRVTLIASAAGESRLRCEKCSKEWTSDSPLTGRRGRWWICPHGCNREAVPMRERAKARGKSITTSITLPADLWKRAKAKAKRTGRSLGEVVSDALAKDLGAQLEGGRNAR